MDDVYKEAERRRVLAAFARQWFSRALAVTDFSSPSGAGAVREMAAEEREMAAYLDEADGYEEAQALPVSDEVDGDLRDILDYLEAESHEAQNAMPADAEVDGEMDEVLDYIDAQQYTPRRAMSSSAEVDGEMDEVLDYIDAQQYSPRRAMSASAEVDGEMDEVLDYIDAQQATQKAWANPFRKSGRIAGGKGRKDARK